MEAKLISKRHILNGKTAEKAILVAIDTSKDKIPVEAPLAELAELTKSAGAEVLGKMVQRLSIPNKTTYLGKGKLDELLALKETLHFDLAIFDDELSILQQKSLEDFLKVKIVDRVTLILDIFARRARTREGQLQVELAQHQYLMPRLVGKWRHLERLGGGIGTRGPGEPQIESDKRLIKKRIEHLKEEIEAVHRQRMLYREKRRRSGIPIVALVGYTNTGKSTLFNALSKSGVMVKNELFSTLDPTTRRLTLHDRSVVLLTDTVGFIRKLPPVIVTAFRATLEELDDASLLVHVVDLTSPRAAEQCDTVEDILKDLNLGSKRRITALNKIDLLLKNNETWDEQKALSYVSAQCGAGEFDTIIVSATKRWGLSKLLELISKAISSGAKDDFTFSSTGDRITYHSEE